MQLCYNNFMHIRAVYCILRLAGVAGSCSNSAQERSVCAKKKRKEGDHREKKKEPAGASRVAKRLSSKVRLYSADRALRRDLSSY